MARKNDSKQKAAMREIMRDYLKNNDISIKNGTDVNFIMRDLRSVLLEGVQDEEFGYSKYDYRNNETDNSHNGHSKKPYIPAIETWILTFSVTVTVNMNHSLSKNTRIL